MAEGTMLPAGRELDALIAERVMGLAIVRPPFVPQGTSSDAIFTDEAADLWRQTYPRGAGVDRVPHYSTDIAAAWQVVKRMREHAPVRYKNLSLVAYCYGRTYATFDAEAFTEYDSATWVEANGEHATPLAICRAALATLPPAGAR